MGRSEGEVIFAGGEEATGSLMTLPGKKEATPFTLGGWGVVVVKESTR